MWSMDQKTKVPELWDAYSRFDWDTGVIDGTPVDIPPAEVLPLYVAVVTASRGLNVRRNPNTGNVPLRALRMGDRVDVYGVENGWAWIKSTGPNGSPPPISRGSNHGRPALSNQEMLDILLPELRTVSQTSQANSVSLAGMAQKLEHLTIITTRLDTAIYGNGKPGLKTTVEQNTSRLNAYTTTCRLDDDLDIVDRIESIETQHMKEKEERDQIAADLVEAKKAEKAEWRKFRWGFIGTIAAVLLDLAARLLKF